jgi:HNH endonuclease
MASELDKPFVIAPMLSMLEPPQVRGPIGRCIYCGKTSPEAYLTTEHGMPRGLGGGFVLVNASCNECRKITHRFETICLRGSFLPFRVKIELQKRNNPERPKSFPLRANPAVAGSRKDVDLEDYPDWLHMPLFPEPAMFRGRSHGLEQIELKMTTFANPTKMNEVAAKHAGTVSADVTFHPLQFMQMLAKIAHCLAWIDPGPEVFRPYLTDLIRDRDKDAAYFIGQGPREIPNNLAPKNPNPLHKILMSILEWGGMNLLIFRIQLFAAFNAPTYFVVVGELTPTADWLARRGLVQEGHRIKVTDQ